MTGRPADRRRLREAIALALSAPPTEHAFSVGALVVAAGGELLSTGYSRESDPMAHAEEVALGKLSWDDPRLAGATLYSSLEPCSRRASRPKSCTQLILDAGIPRIVFAWREPPIFVEGDGATLLRAAGREVVQIEELAALARAANAHLPGITA